MLYALSNKYNWIYNHAKLIMHHFFLFMSSTSPRKAFKVYFLSSASSLLCQICVNFLQAILRSLILKKQICVIFLPCGLCFAWMSFFKLFQLPKTICSYFILLINGKSTIDKGWLQCLYSILFKIIHSI